VRSDRLLQVLVALLVLAVPVAADVDVELAAKGNVLGTLLPEGEVDVFRFDAVAGTQLTLAVSARKKAPLDFALVILGPDMLAVDPNGAKAFVDKGSSLRIKNLPLTQTGSYTIQVVATGTGEYKLSVKALPPRKTSTSAEVPAAGSTMVAFAAPPGALLTLKAKAPKGSGAVPRFGAFGTDDLSTEGALKPTSHVVKVEAGVGGDLEVELMNTGKGSAELAVTIAIKSPKSKPAKLDVRAASLGMPAGGETFVGVQIDGAAGGSVAVDDDDSTIAGARVDVPAGAYPGTLLVTIATAEADAVGDDGSLAAGDTLTLGPAGADFDLPVTVTLPFQEGRLPVGAMGAAVSVQQLKAKNASATQTPVAVDDLADTVSVEVDGFSSFTCIAGKGSPKLNGRSYWFFGQDVELFSGGVPSTGRRVVQENGVVSFVGDGAGTFTFAGNELGVDSDQNVKSGQASVTTFSSPLTEGEVGGTWLYDPTGQSITIEVGKGDNETFWVAEDGSMFLSAVDKDDDPRTQLTMFVEQPATAPSLSELAGDWHVFDYRYEVVETGAGLEMAGANSVGMATLKDNGTLKIGLTERESRFGFDTGDVFDRGVGKGSVAATHVVQLDGSVLVDFGGGEVERFFPNIDNTLLIGSVPQGGLPPTEGLFSMAVLVRRGSGLGPASLSGDFVFQGQEMEYSPAGVGQDTVPDFETVSLEDSVMFDGTAALMGSGAYEKIVRRDDNQQDGVSVTQSGGNFLPPSFSLAANGVFKVSDAGEPGGLTGACNPAGTFVFGVQDPKTAEDFFAAYVLMKLPPEVQLP